MAFEVIPVDPTGFNAGGEAYISDGSGTFGPKTVDKWDQQDVYVDPWSELGLFNIFIRKWKRQRQFQLF